MRAWTVPKPLLEPRAVLGLGALIGLGDGADLHDGDAVRVDLLALGLAHLPEAVEDAGTAHPDAEPREEHERRVLLEDPVHRRGRAAAGEPQRWVRILHGPGPQVDVGVLGETPVEGERLVRSPRAAQQVVALAEACP